MFFWDDSYLSLDEWMVRTLMSIQSANFWKLFERRPRYRYSMGAMDFDYWLLPFLLGLKRRV